MTYNHNWRTLKKLRPLSAKALGRIRLVLEKYADRVQLGSKDTRRPIVEDNMILFDDAKGRGTAFQWDLERGFGGIISDWDRHYDLVVCLVLLILKEEYNEDFLVTSDDSPDCPWWKPAFEEMDALFDLKADASWITDVDLSESKNYGSDDEHGQSGDYCRSVAKSMGMEAAQSSCSISSSKFSDILQKLGLTMVHQEMGPDGIVRDI